MNKRRLGWATLLAVSMGVVVVSASSFLLPLMCEAQPAASQRTVEGVVLDAGDVPLSGAIVYLKNVRTLSIRSFISTGNGGYRFGQMTVSTDYELWAELKGKKSAVKSLSSFDNRKQTTINLKIDAK